MESEAIVKLATQLVGGLGIFSLGMKHMSDGKKHMEDLSRGAIAPSVTVAFMAALNAYSRVRDHVHSVAEEISEEK